MTASRRPALRRRAQWAGDLRDARRSGGGSTGHVPRVVKTTRGGGGSARHAGQRRPGGGRHPCVWKGSLYRRLCIYTRIRSESPDLLPSSHKRARAPRPVPVRVLVLRTSLPVRVSSVLGTALGGLRVPAEAAGGQRVTDTRASTGGHPRLQFSGLYAPRRRAGTFQWRQRPRPNQRSARLVRMRQAGPARPWQQAHPRCVFVE